MKKKIIAFLATFIMGVLILAKIFVNKNNIKLDDAKDFNYVFLKLENKKENKIYSPLSIRYAMKMLEDGANGKSKEEISNLGLGSLSKYNNNANMSLANGFFIKNDFESFVKEEYINNLKDKYDAEIIFDDFKNAHNVNDWLKDKTLGLIDKAVSDDAVSNSKLILANALAIDMEWDESFISKNKKNDYLHEGENGIPISINTPEMVYPNIFNNKEVSGMRISAGINNYDIINTIGKDKIIETVKNEYKKYLDNLSLDEFKWIFNTNKSEKFITKEIDSYVNKYIKEISNNYGKTYSSSEFKYYVSDDVKVFSKKTKQYGDNYFEYIGIMPIKEDLNKYIEKLSYDKIDDLLINLKSIDRDNHEDGYLTLIDGFIPKFKFDYELKLKDDLENLGVNEVFNPEKADLTKIVTEDLNIYVSDAIHKANIDFSQEGIKAAAVTVLMMKESSMAIGNNFDYVYSVPIKRIDLTFDKPFMFIIRDNNNQIWFLGTVYNPTLWSEEDFK